MITMADAVPGDIDAIVALDAELDEFYGPGGPVVAAVRSSSPSTRGRR